MNYVVAGVQRSSRALAMAATLVIFVMLATNVVDVALRTTIGQPLSGVFEYTEVALVSVVFLGLPYTMQVGGHVAIDSVTTRLPERWGRALEVMALVIVLPFVLWLTVASWRIALASFASREAKFGVIAAPVWPARFVIAIGAAFLTAEIAIAMVRAFRGARSPKPSDGDPTDLV